MYQSASRAFGQVHHLGDRWGIGLTSDDYGTGLDEGRVARLVQVGPEVPGLVPVVEVTADVDADQSELSPRSRLTIVGVRLTSA